MSSGLRRGTTRTRPTSSRPVTRPSTPTSESVRCGRHSPFSRSTYREFARSEPGWPSSRERDDVMLAAVEASISRRRLRRTRHGIYRPAVGRAGDVGTAISSTTSTNAIATTTKSFNVATVSRTTSTGHNEGKDDRQERSSDEPAHPLIVRGRAKGPDTFLRSSAGRRNDGFSVGVTAHGASSEVRLLEVREGCTRSRDSSPLASVGSRAHRRPAFRLSSGMPPAGIEPCARGLGNRCSIH